MSWIKRKGKWVLTLGRMAWEGKTKAEVRELADAELGELLENRLGEPPEVLRVPGLGGRIIVLFHGLNGIIHQWYARCEDPSRMRAEGSSSMGETSMISAILAKRRDLAQLAYGEGNYNPAEWLAPGDSAGHAELAAYIRWQETYATAKKEGKTDTEARALAYAAQK